MRSRLSTFSALSVLTSLFALMASPLPAQQTYATASGSLYTSVTLGGCAFGGICVPPPTTYGDIYTGPITAAGVSAQISWPGWHSPYPLPGGTPMPGGSATVSASLLSNSLVVDFQGSGGFPWSDRADIDLSLHGPANQEVHLQLPVNPFTTTVTVAGQSLGQGSAMVTNIPANGVLPISVLVTRSVLQGTGSMTLSWSYPNVTNAGAATPGCLGPAIAGAQGEPLLGNTGFGITCANAPASSGALSIIGLSGFSTTPLNIAGINLWVDPNLPVSTSFQTSDAQGDILRPLPVPADPNLVGLEMWAQFLLVEPAGCTPTNLSASNALRIVVDA